MNSQQQRTGIKASGISGIQRSIETRLNNQEQNIQESFKDLNNLIDKAKDMVQLSSLIIEKIKAKQQQTENEDEINNLKACLLNMGIINNPVTKDSSGSKYYRDLAMEIFKNFKDKIAEYGGVMLLSDIYCRLNRARGMAGLISPEDLQNACKQFAFIKNVNIKYLIYQQNIHVLQIDEVLYDSVKLDKIYELIRSRDTQEGGLSADNLSKLLNISVLVAKQQLLHAERIGKLCRDDTNYGLYFYINLFL